MGKQSKRIWEPKSKNIYKYYRTPIHREQTITRRNVYSYNEFTRSASRSACSAYKHNQVYGAYSRPSTVRPPNVRHRKKPPRKLPSRPSSPALGSEEYMVRKIKQTSAIIMEQLLNPDRHDAVTTQNQEGDRAECSKTIESNPTSSKSNTNLNNVHKNNKKITTYNIEEIHKKIMDHITKLNDGKKKNLINSKTSGYDVAIDQIQKQKRLEISRALRDMGSQSQESNDLINSIIPDMGIKIEDLPHNLIEELRNNLGFDLVCLNGIYDSYNNTSKTQDSFAKVPAGPVSSAPVDAEPVYEDPLHMPNIRTYQGIRKKLSPHGSNSGMNEELKNIRNDCSDSEIRVIEEVIPEVDITCEALLSLPADNSNSNNTISNAVEIKNEICIYPHELQESSDNVTSIHEKVDVIDTSINEIDKSNVLDHEEVRIKKEVCDNREADEFPSLETLLTFIPLNDGMRKNDQDSIPNVEIKKEVCGYPDDLPASSPSVPTSIVDRLDVVDASINRAENANDDNSRETACQFKNECVTRSSIGTQTEEEIKCTAESYLNSFEKEYFRKEPDSISDAIRKMFEIDEYILRLTKCRQALFNNFCKPECTDSQMAVERLSPPRDIQQSPTDVRVEESYTKSITRKRKLHSCDQENSEVAQGTKPDGRTRRKNVMKRQLLGPDLQQNSATCYESTKNAETSNDGVHDNEEESSGESSRGSVQTYQTIHQKLLEFQDVHEKILVLKVMGNKLVAGAESGKIFFCSLDDGHFTKVLGISTVPVTSLLYVTSEQGDAQIYVGSYETDLKVYNFESDCLLKTIPVDDSVQCMEAKWGYIFIGCIRGTLLRYSIQKQMIEYEDNFTNNSILVLKPTLEGARHILLIGSRNSSVCIRDAMTGLFMRTLAGTASPTVYSLVMENSLVYCGTSNHDILIYNFNDGRLMHTFDAGSKGIGCMKIMNNLLFASCHNGSIYVYNIKTNVFIDKIAGPGGVILSMEVLQNQIIVGTMSFKFTSIPIPVHIIAF